MPQPDVNSLVVIVVGPRALPAAGLVKVWIDAGSGPGHVRDVPADRLTLAPGDDGQGKHALYRLHPPGHRPPLALQPKGQEMKNLSDVRWFKSSRSGAAGHCVEVAFLEQRQVGVRDSKDRSGPVLLLDAEQWGGFLAGVKAGEFTR